jgi:hypothetical protein
MMGITRGKFNSVLRRTDDLIFALTRLAALGSGLTGGDARIA